jgi:gamma-glutamyltranspeptidase/glutathione hydrolase
MVATQHHVATDAGEAMLRSGGNAVDAAVAAAFTLGVVEPAASGLGGQTVMLLHLDENKRKFCLDGGSRAPHRTPPGELNREEQLRGHKASTVPSTPAVLAWALQRYGSKSLEEVLEPAIEAAAAGYRVSLLQHQLAGRELGHLKEFPGGKLFLEGGERPYAAGSVFRQPALAGCLRRLSEAGIEDFYQGDIARLIHQDMVANDGLIRDDDLAQIPWPVERNPLAARHGSHRVLTFGPPGAGRALVEALNLLEQFPAAMRDPDSPEGALLLTHVILKANLDRSDRPEDPALYAEELERGEAITRPDYARWAAGRIRSRIRTQGETTHLSVMDKAGNAVALTQSIERVYGSFSASPKLGFLYNNYMSAFEYRDIRHPYYLRPGANPWTSVAPTIVYKGPRPWLALGSPGSERIVSAILQVLLRLELGSSPFEAVAAPRLHCSIRGKVSLEASRMHEEIPRRLQEHGFDIDERQPYSFYLGCVQLVQRENDEFLGVSDPRRDGSARGPDA